MKCKQADKGRKLVDVAPHWGAWIEISARGNAEHCAACRTPLGCVD